MYQERPLLLTSDRIAIPPPKKKQKKNTDKLLKKGEADNAKNIL